MSDTGKDLFGHAPVPTPTAAPAPPRLVWHLPTNQLNLMYLLAAGLITGPKGFGRKYYQDVLSICPGWLPLFAAAIPGEALDLAVSEAGHLRRVVAALDLSGLEGPVQALGPDGEIRPLQFPQGLTGTEQVLFVPAPLPATWIQAILFASKEDSAATLDEAADYANVPMASYKRQVKPKLFTAASKVPWPSAAGVLPERDESIHAVAGIGASAGPALCPRQSGRQPGGCWSPPVGSSRPRATDRCPQGTPAGGPESLGQPGRSGGRAGYPGASAPGDPTRRGGCQGPEGQPVRCRVRCEGLTLDPRQAVLDVLEAQRRHLPEDKWQSALERLGGDLRGIVGLGGDTVSALLTRHTKPFSRGLILFFLREACQDLLDLRQPLLTGMDTVIAAALFGARSGWMGLPAEVRAQPGLREAITHRMAALAQRHRQTGLDLGPAPKRVLSLRELLGPREGVWSKSQQAGALTLARGMGWSQVMQTRISLGKGDYRLQVDGRGAHILLDGEVKAVTTEIDREGFFARLAEAEIPVRLDTKVRADLGS